MGQEYESGRQHVSEAIRINTHRGRIYATVTGGKSRSLTRFLVTLECLSIIPLSFFDWWGKKYNREGIHIIEGDFVPMARIKEHSAPLRLDGQSSDDHRRQLASAIGAYQKKTLPSARRGDFLKTAENTYALLQLVHDLEADSQSLFPMTRHIAESVGIAAYHSVGYAEQSQGRTTLLSKAFVSFQIYALNSGIGVDKMAQACHALGAGIIENDVPYIPFEEAWREYCGSTVKS